MYKRPGRAPAIAAVLQWTITNQLFWHLRRIMMRLAAPDVIISATPNPVNGTAKVHYRVSTAANVVIQVTDGNGNVVGTLQNGRQAAGTYNITWNASGVPAGIYFIHTKENGMIKQTVKIIKQ